MAWIKVDDGFPRHRRIQELGRDVVAKWLHMTALCYCGEHLTDGMLDATAIRHIIAVADVPKPTAERCIPKLVDVGLWLEVEGGWMIRDFLDYNPPAAVVREQRAKARERMSRLRRSREHDANVRGSFAACSQPPSPTPEEQDQVLLARAAVDRSLRSVG